MRRAAGTGLITPNQQALILDLIKHRKQPGKFTDFGNIHTFCLFRRLNRIGRQPFILDPADLAVICSHRPDTAYPQFARFLRDKIKSGLLHRGK